MNVFPGAMLAEIRTSVFGIGAASGAVRCGAAQKIAQAPAKQQSSPGRTAYLRIQPPDACKFVLRDVIPFPHFPTTRNPPVFSNCSQLSVA